MTTAAIPLPPVQRPYLFVALALAAGLFIHLSASGAKLPALFAVGLGMGVALYHAAFGFTAAYRRAFLEGDISGITAQLVMLAAAMLLFAPVLAEGKIFGHGVSGAIAPVGISMAFGAFIFGIGMQLGGGCGSGTLFTVGGGNLRMVLTLVFFCIGGLWGSLDLEWWTKLPKFNSIALGREFGWGPGMTMQLVALGLIYLGLRQLGGENKRSMWWEGGFTWQRLLRGSWPLLLSAGLLALFNWATLLIAGHPWSITWAFTLWAAKAAVALGWDLSSTWFWSGGFTGRALAKPILADVTSVMNIGIMFGAFVAASLAGKVAPKIDIPLRSLLAAMVGGVMLGYGARLAYGCNIGAFFSGVASTSLHGWAWIVFALAGNFIGVRLRPLFGL
ncbi:MAG: YeeE/YedE family protein [Rhodospirillales bacterium]|nr:YeeE/YedE family protein [Rhodospirillales bacterium]